jgi:hypothetical protein
VIYLAVAPKSNAGYMAYNKAKAFVKGDTTRPVPLHLRNAPTKLMKQLDYGRATAMPTARRAALRRASAICLKEWKTPASTSPWRGAGNQDRPEAGGAQGAQRRRSCGR